MARNHLIFWLALIAGVWSAVACAHRPVLDGPSGLYSKVVDFYSGPLDHLSAVRAGQCPMYPSCSRYSRQAVERYGWVKGWVMTMDRLMRCGRDEVRLAPRVLIGDQWKIYDPVENNDRGLGCPAAWPVAVRGFGQAEAEQQIWPPDPSDALD
jgi:hypothetical protein